MNLAAFPWSSLGVPLMAAALVLFLADRAPAIYATLSSLVPSPRPSQPASPSTPSLENPTAAVIAAYQACAAAGNAAACDHLTAALRCTIEKGGADVAA